MHTYTIHSNNFINTSGSTTFLYFTTPSYGYDSPGGTVKTSFITRMILSIERLFGSLY